MGATGLKLATYPHPRMTPLADHKTLNYLYYYQAGVWAREQGADEAVILNPDGTISETNTANITGCFGQDGDPPPVSLCAARSDASCGLPALPCAGIFHCGSSDPPRSRHGGRHGSAHQRPYGRRAGLASGQPAVEIRPIVDRIPQQRSF